MLLSVHLLLPPAGTDAGKQTSGTYVVLKHYSEAHIHKGSYRETYICKRWLIRKTKKPKNTHTQKPSKNPPKPQKIKQVSV